VADVVHAAPVPPSPTPGSLGERARSEARLPAVAVQLGERTSTGVIDGAGEATKIANHLPPFFTGDALRFAGPADLAGARAEFVAVGAVLAVCDTKPPLQSVEIRLLCGEREAPGRVRCNVFPMQPGTVVVQAQDKSAWAPLVDRLLAPAVSTTESNPPVALAVPPRPLSFARTGHLTNPRTLRELLTLPAHRPVTDDDLRRPSVPLLLRWLRTTRGVFRIDFARSGQAIHSVFVVDGRELRSPVALPSLGRALADAELDYEMHELGKAPSTTHTLRTLHLMAEVIRSMLGQHAPEEIARHFPHTGDPRLVRAVTTVADALAFPSTHTRLLKQAFAGDEAIEDILKNPIGLRTAWDILVLLELFGGLQFVAGERRTAAPIGRVGDLPPEAMLEKDLFAVLGLHWSSSPNEIAPAYMATRQQWTGPRRPADGALAERILARIEEAHRTLRDDVRRQAYRRQTFNLVWSHQAQLLVAQAKLAIYRKDAGEARRLLTAAEDCSPSAEAANLLLALSSATSADKDEAG
jgi:hypothetical protein